MDNRTQKLIELQKQNVTLQDKVTFMYLAAATASIGYIATQIKELTFSLSSLIPFISIFCFAMSFYYGSRYLDYFLETIQHDFIRLRDAKDNHESRSSSSNMMITSYNKQKRMILLGALSYITWLFVNML